MQKKTEEKEKRNLRHADSCDNCIYHEDRCNRIIVYCKKHEIIVQTDYICNNYQATTFHLDKGENWGKPL